MGCALAHLKTVKPVEVEFYRIPEDLDSADSFERMTAAHHKTNMVQPVAMGRHRCTEDHDRTFGMIRSLG